MDQGSTGLTDGVRAQIEVRELKELVEAQDKLIDVLFSVNERLEAEIKTWQMRYANAVETAIDAALRQRELDRV